ncbi:MAG: hypothetical protein L6Q97_20405 [Thermoanaerobaculia bacterium]|nr:hypothetical protein [Thermoanaerobaculia bacterium]
METIPTETSPNTENYKLIRERWDKEDTLLLSRTGIFLTTNSILYAAIGFQEKDQSDQSLHLVFALVGLLLSILWLTSALHSFNVIKNLFLACKDDMPTEIKRIYKVKPVLFRPNTVFCKWIPGIVIASWLFILLWLLF